MRVNKLGKELEELRNDVASQQTELLRIIEQRILSITEIRNNGEAI